MTPVCFYNREVFRPLLRAGLFSGGGCFPFASAKLGVFSESAKFFGIFFLDFFVFFVACSQAYVGIWFIYNMLRREWLIQYFLKQMGRIEEIR